MTETAHSLVLRMDPSSPDTSQRIERVSERIDCVRARTRALSRQIAALTGQFVDDALFEPSGPRRGQRLARQGRIEWLSRLAKLHRSYCAACHEEVELHALLRRMQESLESALNSDQGMQPPVPAGAHSREST